MSLLSVNISLFHFEIIRAVNPSPDHSRAVRISLPCMVRTVPRYFPTYSQSGPLVARPKTSSHSAPAASFSYIAGPPHLPCFLTSSDMKHDGFPHTPRFMFILGRLFRLLAIRRKRMKLSLSLSAMYQCTQPTHASPKSADRCQGRVQV